MDTDNHTRKALRFKPNDLKVEFDDGKLVADVTDVSLEGLSFVANESIGNFACMRFIDGGKSALYPLAGQILNSTSIKVNGTDCYRHGIKFDSILRPERLGNFNKHFLTPAERIPSNLQQFEIQKSLAMSDLSALQKSMLGT